MPNGLSPPAAHRQSRPRSPRGSDGHEPAAREEDLAVAELGRELFRTEEALVDLPARAVVQHPLLPLDGLDVLAEGGVDDDELGSDAAGLGEKRDPLVLLEMTVEVAREDAAERTVRKGKRKRVALDEAGSRDPPRGDLQHRGALIEARDLPRQVARQVSRAAGDVERGHRLERAEDAEQRLPLALPAGPVALLEEAGADPPVVVLLRARLVVGLHAPRVRVVLEAVPNFSEGRNEAVIGALRESLSAPARLLDVHTDADHHRSVFTLVGEPDDLVKTLLAGIACARERIDLRRHEGAHPRIGAADVVPIVPIRRDDRDLARDTARTLAGRIGDELGLPVFLYGGLAPGRGPAFFRRGGPVELQRRIADGELAPDFGPAQLDERAGGVIVGARDPLIAFNVNLRGSLEVAKAVAAVVRETGGGFPGVRALGLELPRAGIVQVSMNVEDWEAAALHEIVARIETEAAKRGAEVLGSELVGLMPAGAAAAAAGEVLRIEGFDESHVLELRLLSEFQRPARR